MSTPDPYAVFALPITATAEQTRVRYRQLALTHHPDKLTGNAEIFKAIQAAYELLIDPARKQAYDETQRLKREMEQQARRARTAGATANESARRANEEQERILRESMREEENRRKREERAAREREESGRKPGAKAKLDDLREGEQRPGVGGSRATTGRGHTDILIKTLSTTTPLHYIHLSQIRDAKQQARELLYSRKPHNMQLKSRNPLPSLGS
ncbi:DnaJ domain-containing protein [Sphaerosporella brunnea]|uniref:DnaJ domain-containing protein n=1 Tax=Sphaerosporella brunnea TaxID=1250544 RepID=A0A5J5FAF0_9PEZI|nr:DnaJ domain-containing protein [Sphaerosporella brunnea]